jgi:hypothetical protein
LSFVPKKVSGSFRKSALSGKKAPCIYVDMWYDEKTTAKGLWEQAEECEKDKVRKC